VRRVITSRYELAEAQALWGELCLDEELSELEHWYRQLPESAQNHAGVWFVRGQWAQRLNRNDVAARCYWECVRLDPTNRRATYQLGQTLAALGSAASEAFLLRAAQLKEIAELVERMLVTQGQDRAAFRKLVELLQQTGRDWEAWAWVALTAGPIGVADPTLPSLAQTPQPPPSAPRFRRDQDLSVLHDLSHLPNFDAVIEVPRSDASSATFGATSTVASAVHFQEEAEKLGVAFTYFQSRDPNPDVVRIFESTGGGIGVLDYDRDGWPDFYFTQGQEWPRGADRPAPTGTYRDVLFRNQVNGFVDVTRSAAFLSDMDYGQGCSCGDFNNDGFPDLYVANVGANRLYQNQGDGTFLDITLQAGIDDSAWTTSCLILDLNADGNPDLYDVNYLQGKHIYRVECAASRCSVKQYEGAPDRVWLSQGDGRFVAVSEATPQHGGKGLGVVALFLDAQPKPHLFIGNDQVPNFLLCPTATDGCYEDQALIRGLALNRNGETTASMGIAAGDINHDGRVDLLVTNFEGEANTLFLQRDQGLFEDAIIGTGLMSAGIRYVGWGAQFLDADNDGELDVIVTNGHVAEFNEPGVEYRMPTQFFHNTGRGFRQPSPAQVGAYFLQNHLGRSLALCDWNRDGLTDVLISHIGTPVAVLTNVSQPTGHWLDVFVSATKSARDAIGTVVELHQGDRVERQQLLAGDGYQVSNERKLHFGLGNRNTIDRLIVHWPSGQKSTWESVPGDRALILIEGESLATLRR
jgi:tetratricopeptide (TPR) repeat protein